MKVLLSLYPESEHFRAVNGLSHKRTTPFHLAAHSDNIEFIQYILTSLTVSERLETVSIEDSGGWNALRHAARSKNPESIKCIITLLTESFHTQSECMQHRIGGVVLRVMVELNIPGLSAFIFTLLPESLIKQIAEEHSDDGRTVFIVQLAQATPKQSKQSSLSIPSQSTYRS